MSLFGTGTSQTSQPPFTGFNFGTASSTAPTQPTATVNPLGGTSTAFGGFAASSALSSSIFGTTQTAPAFSSSLFSSGTSTSSSSFPTASSTGFSLGGTFGQPATTSTPFGTTSLAPVATTTTTTVGLGGVDIQTTSGLSGGTTTTKKDGKSVKETPIPNELAVTVESFKKYVKDQKSIREEMSRVSSQPMFKVAELVSTLKQQLAVVNNGLQRNAAAIAKLKDESNQELKNAEIAQRNKDFDLSMHYESNATNEYFHNLANNFEKQMQVYRQQIEQLERHLVTLSEPYILTPTEWTAITKKIHETFVVLAAQLQIVHQEIQNLKERVLSKPEQPYLAPSSLLPAPVSYGPSPFSAVQSAVGKAICNVFSASQIPGGTGSSMGLSRLEGVDRHFSVTAKRTAAFSMSVTPFKPLGQSAATFGSPTSGNFAGGGDTSLEGQKTFQLQKPPAGNKRGKRWTST